MTEDEASGEAREPEEEPGGVVARPLDPLAEAEPHEKGAHEEVDQGRVPQQHRLVDHALAEERVREEEGEQCEDVEVAQGKELVFAHEGEGEGQRERPPHVPVVRLLAVGALLAARHRPAYLVAGPGVLYVPGLVVDPDARDLLPITAPRAAAHQPALLDEEVNRPLAVFVLGPGAVGTVL